MRQKTERHQDAAERTISVGSGSGLASERKLTRCWREFMAGSLRATTPPIPYARDTLVARCANTIATPPKVAAEASNRRSVICSESRTTPPKAVIAGTES